VVSYGGNAIGTLSGGSNGANLRIDFTSTTRPRRTPSSADPAPGLRATPTPAPTPAARWPCASPTATAASSTPNHADDQRHPELDGTPAAYGEEPVNTFTPSDQSNPAIGRLTDGGYVIAWNSYAQDTSSWGTYAQRYTASGEAVGPENSGSTRLRPASKAPRKSRASRTAAT
jgi:hypothetical protein